MGLLNPKLRLWRKQKFLPEKRVAGRHDVRLDGLSDLLIRARGMSILDVGCNRGLISYEFSNNGATTIHGLDNYEEGIRTAREIFADVPQVESQFEVVDLTKGGKAIELAFGESYRAKYDLILLIAVYQKLKRVMSDADLRSLILHLASRTGGYFAYCGIHEDEMNAIMDTVEMEKIHWSKIAGWHGSANIWRPR
jgi:ribosomal protein L11 methylase PrmA